jgi:hypothetical protein
MGLTKFPNGVSSFGMPIIGSGSLMTTGNVFFVDSGNALGVDDPIAGVDSSRPFLTLDYAIGQCTASTGDVIFCMPGHAETVAAADITMDVIGVSVIGLGHGDNRPTFTFDATGSTIAMSAASTRLSNVILTPGIAAVDAAITATGAAVEIDNIETKIAAVYEFDIGISVTGNNTIIRDCVINTLDGAGSATGISLDGCERVLITRNVIQGNFSDSAISNLAAQAIQITITHNVISNQSAAGVILMDTLATGTIAYNSLSARSSTLLDTTLFIPGDTLCNENYLCNEVDTTGVVLPATASTS